MKLHTKLLTSVLAVGLTVALVGGSTMAWFTDSKNVAPATFTAGTVRLDGTSSSVALTAPTQIDNLNPGDNLGGNITIVNSGTKAVKVRVKLPDYYWAEANGTRLGLSTANITSIVYAPNWTISGGYAYYTPAVLGTMADGQYAAAADASARTITFSISAVLDGAATDNQYQGKKLCLSGFTVESIQATNNAAWPSSGAVAPATAA